MKAILFPALMGAVVLLGAAAADQKPRVAGPWAFKTEAYHDGACTLEGAMTLRPGASPDVFECRLSAVEKCPDLQIRSEQICEARLGPTGLSVKSTVIKTTPPDEDFSYLPDNFELPLVTSERMEGDLRSAPIGEAAASSWAQGGLAAALAPDDCPAAHAADTVAAGAGLVDPSVALLLAEQGPARVRDLLELGVPFDRSETGALRQSLEAAHSFPRVVRVAGDLAGRAIMDSLTRAVAAAEHISVVEPAR